MLDNFCSKIGVHVKRWICNVAAWRGKGPHEAEMQLRLLVYGRGDDEWRKAIHAINSGNLEHISKLCDQLEDYANK